MSPVIVRFSRTLSLALPAAAWLVLCGTPPVRAADYFWYGSDELLGGNNTWNATGAYWKNDAGTRLAWPNSATAADRAVFAGTESAPFTVTLASGTTINANALWFRTNYTLAAGDSAAVLNFVGATPTLTVDSGFTVTSNVVVNGSSVTLNGGGTWAPGAGNLLGNSLGLIVAGGSTFSLGALADTIGDLRLVSGTLAGTGTLTTTGAFTLESGTVGLRLGGTGRSLFKVTSGTVLLNGSATYTGATNVLGGTLQLGANDRIANNSALVVDGGTFALGAYRETVGTVTLASGSITGTSGRLTGSAFDLRSGLVSARLVGTSRVATKTTDGIVTLTGANTYTGATNLNAGALVLGSGGSISSSSRITVAAGATLAGVSTTNTAPVTVNGILSPGALSPAGLSSIGTLATGAEIWNPGGSYLWQVNSTPALGSAGTNWDRLSIGGSLALSATNTNPFTVRVVGLTAGGMTGAISGFDNTRGYTWSLLTASAISGFSAGEFQVDASAFAASNPLGGGSFSVAQSGTTLNLVFTPVPEPRTYALLLGMGTLGFLFVRRRAMRC